MHDTAEIIPSLSWYAVINPLFMTNAFVVFSIRYSLFNIALAMFSICSPIDIPPIDTPGMMMLFIFMVALYFGELAKISLMNTLMTVSLSLPTNFTSITFYSFVAFHEGLLLADCSPSRQTAIGQKPPVAKDCSRPKADLHPAC